MKALTARDVLLMFEAMDFAAAQQKEAERRSPMKCATTPPYVFEQRKPGAWEWREADTFQEATALYDAGWEWIEGGCDTSSGPACEACTRLIEHIQRAEYFDLFAEWAASTFNNNAWYTVTPKVLEAVRADWSNWTEALYQWSDGEVDWETLGPVEFQEALEDLPDAIVTHIGESLRELEDTLGEGV